MIAPHFERLAKEHSRPKKVAFVKVNVDSQSSISRAEGVSAMPTFKIYHGGRCVETVKGANPPVLAESISKAVKLGEAGKPGDSFKTPGRTLGGEGGTASGRRMGAAGGSSTGIMNWDLNNLINSIVILVGLYLVSLFSVSPPPWHKFRGTALRPSKDLRND
jgi:thiol-disulfide isomerase/thioredoxin